MTDEIQPLRPVFSDRVEPLYEQLAQRLAHGIVSHRYPPGSRLPRERDLELDHQVSRQTVRAALAVLEARGLIHRVRGKGTFVTTDESVPPAHVGLGDTVLLVLLGPGPLLVSEYYQSVGRGVAAGARAFGLKVKAVRVDQGIGESLERYRPGEPGDARGAVLLGTFEDTYLQRLESEGWPFVVVDYRARTSGIDCVAVDVQAEAYVAMSHLKELGHRTVGFVGHGRRDVRLGMYEFDPDVWLLADGLGRAAMECGMQMHPEWVVTATSGGQPLVDAIGGLLSLRPRPTSVICFNDHVLGVFFEVAERMSVSCPGDISLIGRGGLECAWVNGREATYLQSSPEQMGESAVRLLAERIRGQRGRAVRLAIASKLVPGDTTGAVDGPAIGT